MNVNPGSTLIQTFDKVQLAQCTTHTVSAELLPGKWKISPYPHLQFNGYMY